MKKIFQLGVGLFPNYYMACSKEAAKFLFRGKAGKAMILKNGVDLKQYKYDEKERIIIRKELRVAKNDIVIGHIGRMDAVKNQAFLIEVLQELNQKNNNYRLILIGDGSEKKKLEELAKKSGTNDRITFLGNKKDSSRYYNAMDVFVFPSKSEGLGIALIEAQANGLKCFASTAVPRDANATKTVTFISLEKTAAEWANIIDEVTLGRFDGQELIKEKGYDISDSARRLQVFYESINQSEEAK
ncbi:MAG: glycosyltransferase [Candidatus Saccharibacteria bacterium]|nr:glycosyltransferase [Candidatus Saccharibacteria bacterium]